MSTLVFLCSSLEPSRDGVGDYVRRLSGELIRQGRQVAAIALFDQHIHDEHVGMQETEGSLLPVYRLPSHWTIQHRFEVAKDWVDQLNPDWLSLQYVPFGFQQKGLPLNLGRYLAKLGNGRKWHIMFHELWVGMSDQAPIKLVCWGIVQRQIILSMLAKLKPLVIHTQTRLYQLYLEKCGYSVSILPLISNIPVLTQVNSNNELTFLLQNKHLNFIVFGAIHPNAPFREFVDDIAQIARARAIVISLTLIGRWSAGHDYWATLWRSKNLPLEILGEQSPACVSIALSKADLGLSSTPYAIVQKSGSVAAMLAHGLPVLSVAQDWKARGIDNVEHSSGIVEYRPGNLELLLRSVRPINSSKNTLSTIAGQLTYSLNQLC